MKLQRRPSEKSILLASQLTQQKNQYQFIENEEKSSNNSNLPPFISGVYAGRYLEYIENTCEDLVNDVMDEVLNAVGGKNKENLGGSNKKSHKKKKKLVIDETISQEPEVYIQPKMEDEDIDLIEEMRHLDDEENQFPHVDQDEDQGEKESDVMMASTTATTHENAPEVDADEGFMDQNTNFSFPLKKIPLKSAQQTPSQQESTPQFFDQEHEEPEHEELENEQPLHAKAPKYAPVQTLGYQSTNNEALLINSTLAKFMESQSETHQVLIKMLGSTQDAWEKTFTKVIWSVLIWSCFVCLLIFWRVGK